MTRGMIACFWSAAELQLIGELLVKQGQTLKKTFFDRYVKAGHQF